MSKSYHATFSKIKGKSRKELEEMAKDPDSILHELTIKSSVKKNEIKKRKEEKESK
jgi:hypothetical protein